MVYYVDCHFMVDNLMDSARFVIYIFVLPIRLQNGSG